MAPRTASTKCFFSDSDEAVIFIKSSDGTIPLMANLTVLAMLRTDGTISSDEELKRHGCTFDRFRRDTELVHYPRRRRASQPRLRTDAQNCRGIPLDVVGAFGPDAAAGWAIRWLHRLQNLPSCDLRALEQDPNGQCRRSIPMPFFPIYPNPIHW